MEVKKLLKIATVFSGIGAFEQALNKKGISHITLFACDNGERNLELTKEEIINSLNKSNSDSINDHVNHLYSKLNKPNYVKETYDLNYTYNEWYEDIRFIDGKKYKDEIDILVGGSPCQSFSIIGKKGGLEDTRGTLFYDYARLIKESQPKVFIFENVAGLLTHDKGRTWGTIHKVFEDLGYQWYMKTINSIDHGIPQQRKRVFVVGFIKNRISFTFPKKRELKTTMFDYLETKVHKRFYLGKKGFEFVTNPRYKNRAQVNSNIIRTQKANQQFNWNGDFYFETVNSFAKRYEQIPSNAYVGDFNGELGVIRKLTHRELLRLMGFSENFKIITHDTQAYRQIGNSIVVTIFEDLIDCILPILEDIQ
jgi:DNA (cytosine-5)-methyltransferase 1